MMKCVSPTEMKVFRYCVNVELERCANASLNFTTILLFHYSNFSRLSEKKAVAK